MSIIIFNPTNEVLTGMQGGIEYPIPAYPDKGCKAKFSDTIANHLLNKLETRGLTTLEYGDDSDGGKVEKKKAAAGRRRNKEFKEKQVLRYNQLNESRKMQGMEFIQAPEQVNKYAEELGQALIQPYVIADTKNAELAQLKAENAELKKDQSDAMATMKDLINTLKAQGIELGGQSDEDKLKEEIKVIQAEYKMMKKGEFEDWIVKIPKNRYYTFPVEVQTDIQNKWEGMWSKEEQPFPL